jgi:glutaredoxin
MYRIVIFSKEGCHLCERAENKLRELSVGREIQIEVVDIRKDSSAFGKYFLSIPVVELDGKIVFQASDINRPDDIERKLEAIVLSID